MQYHAILLYVMPRHVVLSCVTKAPETNAMERREWEALAAPLPSNALPTSTRPPTSRGLAGSGLGGAALECGGVEGGA